MNYESMKPGLYLQIGDQYKALTTQQDGAYKSHGRDYVGTFGDLMSQNQQGVERLAAQVGWVFVAIEKRKRQILEIPHQWQLRDEDIDKLPFKMPFREQVQQIDESLQYYKVAYLLKQKARGRLVGVRWLDPACVEPDYENATPEEGVQNYYYTMKRGARRTIIPAEDMIVFKLPGMRELEPGTSAGEATRLAAQVAYGITQTSNVFFGNNGLPIMMVMIPSSTAEAETTRLERFFKRLANPRRGTTEIRTTAVRGDVKVETLSLAPKDLAQKDLEESQVDLILAAHDVPKSIALANAANYATDIAAERRFVAALGSRLEYVASVLNEDDDLAAFGVSLAVRVQDHYTMKEDEAQRAGAFVSFQSGGFTPQAAAYLVGITEEDFPQEFGPVFADVVAEPEPMPEEDDETDDEERQAEMKAYRKYLKKRANPNPDNFETYHMTEQEKEEVYWQVKGTGYEQPDVTADLLYQFSEAMKRFDESIQGTNGTGEHGGNSNGDEGHHGLSPEPETTGTPVLE